LDALYHPAGHVERGFELPRRASSPRARDAPRRRANGAERPTRDRLAAMHAALAAAERGQLPRRHRARRRPPRALREIEHPELVAVSESWKDEALARAHAMTSRSCCATL